MNRVRIFFLAALFSITGAAQAIVIDFEDLVGQSALPSNYAGLTWGAGWEYYDWSQPPYNPSSGQQRVYNNSGPSTDGFSFAADVVFDGAYFAGSSTAQFELYNNGVLVFSSGTIVLSSVPTFLASGYNGFVDEVRLNVSNGSFVMDDVTYNSRANVPEPAPLALMALGLVALGMFRRRK